METNFIGNEDENERFRKMLWGITMWHLVLYCVLLAKLSIWREVVFPDIVEAVFTKVCIAYVLWYGCLVAIISVFFFFFYLVGTLRMLWRREVAGDVKGFCICLVGTVLNACFCVWHICVIGSFY